MKSVFGDNFKVYVRASGREAFECAMSLAFNGKDAKYWAETKAWGLVYMWYVSEHEGLNTDHHHMESEFEDYDYHSTDSNREQLYTRNTHRMFWNEEYQIHRFDEPLSVGSLLDQTWDWLNHPDRDYPEPDDHDGSNNKGFTIATQEGLWEGHIGSHHGGICFIRPDWMWIGK